jgi:arylsulfatase A-like enzyme
MAYHAVHAPFDPKPELLSKYQNKTNSKSDAAAYAATVEALDQNIGRLYKYLKSVGLARNTYILFTSDNGGANKYVTPLRGGKGTLYEGGIRVPAFAVGPDIKPNQISDEAISSIDFFPTLLDLAGLNVPEVDGLSLVPVMTQGKKLSREALYWHFPCYIGRGTPASAIRLGNYKLIEFFETKTIELYDLSKDPSESKDISRTQPELVDLIYAKLKKWQAETNAPCPTKTNPSYDPTAQRQRGRKSRGKRRNRRGANR